MHQFYNSRVCQHIQYSPHTTLNLKVHIRKNDPYTIIYDIIMVIHGNTFVSTHNNYTDATITFNLNKQSIRRMFQLETDLRKIESPLYADDIAYNILNDLTESTS